MLQVQFSRLDLLVEQILVVVVMRRLTSEKLKKDDANLVDVTRFADTLLRKHLWSEVGRRAAKGLCTLSLINILFSQPKVGEAAVAISVDQYVLWLEVAIDDVQAMQVLDGENNLGHKELSFALKEYLSLLEVVC